MLKAVPRQTLAITADQIAICGSESQATGDRPIIRSSALRKP